VSTTPEAAIRPAQDSDADAIRVIYGPVVTATSISFKDEVPSREEIVRRMGSRPTLPWLVAGSGAEVVGFAYASHYRTRPAYRWSAECSVYVAETHRRRGIGRRLYQRLITEVRDLGYASLFAGIALPNPASVDLHETLGFRPVGVFPNVGFKRGGWHGVGWWSLPLLPVPPSAPAEPREWRIES
jgi:L-amino acid N-acyltransferase YncA